MLRQKKKQQTKNLLFNTSIELFKKQGFQETTVQQITDQAGVAKGTFFNYYPSKESILLEIRISQLQSINQFAENATHQSAIEALIILFRRISEQMDKYGKKVALSIFQLLYSRPSLTIHEATPYNQFHVTIRTIIQDGQIKGEFSSKMDSSQLATTLTNTYLGSLLSWASGAEDIPFTEVILDILAPFLELIKVDN
ncbi:TetR/AcrR family transcriptional regulator [Cytobacillus spongiae]|uniref:TetR/AcrR family transcriptional regulator n=1 Tax=Cytobacillus spongiae TaxID=2901381 RepID=UPI001F3929C2|nr:TetR/AcrR family transcriptional regulator [Cytobacillus spongiae]UII57209.1 TetR/AcrR family transcriptional regulator [Cytobacillus spongiae]